MEQDVTDPRGSRACAYAEDRLCERSRRSVVDAPGAAATDFLRPREGVQRYPVGESDPTRYARLVASTLEASALEQQGATARRLATSAAAQIVLHADDNTR